ncbi:MAG: Lar family restriction alleviation protein [Lachnospiraceae bacterium]|nr:Lar family restriction alleviation protein [Lachnospiraceae bacterium]
MIDENMRKKILDEMELDAKVIQEIKEEIQNKTELKPCPFCGENAYLFIVHRKSQVSCTYCHASTAVYKDMGAVREWNRRV